LATNPFILPDLPIAAHSEQDVTDSLNYLFKNFLPAAGQYSLYFQLMPVFQSPTDLQTLLSDALQSVGTVVTKPLHTGIAVPGVSVGIRGVVKTDWNTADVFQSSQPPRSTSNQMNSVFIVLDGFPNTAVPIEVACALEASFIDGFATRLVLGQFKKFWDANRDSAAGSGYGPPANYNLDIGPVTPNQSPLSGFTQLASYPPYDKVMGVGTGEPSYLDDLSTLLGANPVTSIGLLYGWRAAEQLEGADAADPTQPLTSEAFRLLKYRFSIRDLGEMTAFTLNYLNGAVENDSIQSIISGAGPQQPADIGSILSALGSDPNIQSAKDFLVGFQDVLLAEFYALTQNSNATLSPDKNQALASYFNFLEGFHQGIATSGAVHFQETFQLAYGLGYKSGFTDGYTLGFATGYNDGFASGNAAAWKAADQIIDNLQDQITQLKNQLAQVKSQGNGAASGPGFWDIVGDVQKAGSLAVSVISML